MEIIAIALKSAAYTFVTLLLMSFGLLPFDISYNGYKPAAGCPKGTTMVPRMESPVTKRTNVGLNPPVAQESLSDRDLFFCIEDRALRVKPQ